MKGKARTLATIAILCMAAVCFIPGPALACFSPTDSFATEVLLNRPGISYDLSGVSQAESVNVTWEEELTFEGELVSSVPDLIIDTVAKGYWSGCQEEEYQVVRSQTEWEELWDKIVADITPKPELPEIDFSEYMLIAAFMGEQSTGGYSIEIAAAFYYLEDIMVTVKRHYPPSGSGVTTALTQPYHVVKIEKSDRKVVFQQVEARSETKTIIYRSHFDPEIAVILSEGMLYPDEARYLSVRIQIPTKSVSYTTWNVDMSLTKPVDMSSLDIEAAKALGWETVSSAGEWPYYKGMFVKDSIAVDILPGQSGEPEETVVMVSISNATLPLAEQAREEIATFLVAIGFAVDEESALDNAEIESYSNEWQDLAPAIDIDPEEFDWKLAMKTELLWLRDNGVIRGLTDSDIDEASFACEKGTAGHNSRVVFEDNEWMPYHKTDNPALLRDGDCGGFSLDSLPDGVLESTGAATNDGSPSSTTYVWAIVGAAIAIGVGTLVWRKRASGRPIG